MKDSILNIRVGYYDPSRLAELLADYHKRTEDARRFDERIVYGFGRAEFTTGNIVWQHSITIETEGHTHRTVGFAGIEFLEDKSLMAYFLPLRTKFSNPKGFKRMTDFLREGSKEINDALSIFEEFGLLIRQKG